MSGNMSFIKALSIVKELATQNALDPNDVSGDEALVAQAEEQDRALETVQRHLDQAIEEESE